MPDRPLNVEVDLMSKAAYITVSDEPVARTVAFNAYTNVDLDALDMVVGVEVLSLSCAWNLREVVDAFHVPSELTEVVASISNPVHPAAAQFVGAPGGVLEVGPDSQHESRLTLTG